MGQLIIYSSKNLLLTRYIISYLTRLTQQLLAKGLLNKEVEDAIKEFRELNRNDKEKISNDCLSLENPKENTLKKCVNLINHTVNGFWSKIGVKRI